MFLSNCQVRLSQDRFPAQLLMRGLGWVWGFLFWVWGFVVSFFFFFPLPNSSLAAISGSGSVEEVASLPNATQATIAGRDGDEARHELYQTGGDPPQRSQILTNKTSRGRFIRVLNPALSKTRRQAVEQTSDRSSLTRGFCPRLRAFGRGGINPA